MTVICNECRKPATLCECAGRLYGTCPNPHCDNCSLIEWDRLVESGLFINGDIHPNAL
ncbi:MAG: hypothetical protein CI953_907 [Methanohalophilus sp.]|jgi:hypothetical protein|nr:MAG: hypothetical protein CI953_907 [Methanohalophilus sp.]